MTKDLEFHRRLDGRVEFQGDAQAVSPERGTSDDVCAVETRASETPAARILSVERPSTECSLLSRRRFLRAIGLDTAVALGLASSACRVRESTDERGSDERGRNPPAFLTGRNFSIVSHLDDSSGLPIALEAAEAAWAEALEFYDGPEPVLDEPLTIHIYPTTSAYEAVEKTLTGGRFRKNLAFSHISSRSAHIALQPLIPSEARAVIGLPPQTLRLVAHEAFHLATYSYVPHASWLPEWFDEGSASSADGEVTKRLSLAPKDDDEDPWSSTYAFLANELLQSDRFPPTSAILRDELDGLDRRERYGLQRLVVTFLRRERPEILTKLIAAAKAETDGYRLREGFRNFERAVVSGSSRNGIEAGFRDFILRRAPKWFEVRRSLVCGPDRWIQCAFESTDAIAVRTDDHGGFVRVRGNCLPLAPSGFGAFVVLRGAATDVEIDRSSTGGTRLVSRAHRKNRGEVIAKSVPDATLPESSEGARSANGSSFDITGDGDRIVVVIDGRVAMDRRVPGFRPLTWGVGTRRSHAALWTDVRQLPKEETVDARGQPR
jgi:hypothetical protein